VEEEEKPKTLLYKTNKHQKDIGDGPIPSFVFVSCACVLL